MFFDCFSIHRLAVGENRVLMWIHARIIAKKARPRPSSIEELSDIGGSSESVVLSVLLVVVLFVVVFVLDVELSGAPISTH